MTRTAGAPIGCQRPSRFWGLGCPKIYHEAEDTLGLPRRKNHSNRPTHRKNPTKHQPAQGKARCADYRRRHR
ncbi:hypothetical protein [Thiolapillus sp.]|uniref:hypothetical protein n=1 Tax=Thiolapillus sp. TaxID=2017437 RepID=UPI00273A3A8A|nr:hypothetical protein [Thiolapillus sp.]